MKQELFGKKAAAKLMVAAVLSASIVPSAWAAADDYTPLGIKSGPFTIFLNGGFGIVYDDNIFALNDDSIDAVNSIAIDEDDFVATVNSGIEARGKFSGGSTLGLYAQGAYGAHFEYDNANYFDAQVGLRSRTFFSKAVSLRAKSEYSYEHEGFGLFDTPLVSPLVTPADVKAFLGSAEPTTLSKVTGDLALDIKPGRTGFTIGANSTGRFYNDKNSFSFEHRNYWDVNVFTELSQELDSTTGFFVKLNGNGRAYPDRNNLPVSQPERDSMGFSAVAGARVKATGTINLEAFAGYVNQNFANDDYDAISDFIFGGNMKWTPSAFFEMKVNADRTVNETSDIISSSYIGTKAETTLSVFPLENLTFWTTGRYINRDYETRKAVGGAPLAGVPDRDDDVIFAEIGGEFKINRNVGLGLHYNYYQRDSSISNNPSYVAPPIDIDFDRQKVMFEVKLAR